MKKSYYCPKLESELNFLPNKIQFCCSAAEGPGIQLTGISGQIDKNAIWDKKRKYISLLKKGIIPKECNKCYEYKENQKGSFFKNLFQADEKTSYIVVNHFLDCNCNCIYCSQKILYPNQSYELLPIIKHFYKNDLIDLNSLRVEFQGGDVSVLNEFEALLNEFKKHNPKTISIHTNGIKYLSAYETIKNNGNNHICISLDAGTRETFKQIKGTDSFYEVLENIQKLREHSDINIILKYIIIENVNDNLYELSQFLDVVSDIENISITLNIDYRSILSIGKSRKRFDVPPHYYEMFQYAKSYCEENNISYYVNSLEERILEKGYSN